jgi:hypothetical protein
MCDKQTKIIKNRLKKNGYLNLYKVLSIVNGQTVTPYMEADFYPGWNISDRESTKITETPNSWDDILEINNGIHVFTNREGARELKSFGDGDVIVKVKCLAKDFVAAGDNQAVFTKVFLPKTEHTRALKGKKNVS